VLDARNHEAAQGLTSAASQKSDLEEIGWAGFTFDVTGTTIANVFYSHEKPFIWQSASVQQPGRPMNALYPQAELIVRNTLNAIPHTYGCLAVAFLVSAVASYAFASKNRFAQVLCAGTGFAAGMVLSVYALPASAGVVGLTGIQTLGWYALSCVPPLVFFQPGVLVSYFGQGALTYIAGVTSFIGAGTGAFVGNAAAGFSGS